MVLQVTPFTEGRSGHAATDESVIAEYCKQARQTVSHQPLDLRVERRSLFIIPNIIIHMHSGNLRPNGN